MVHYDQSTDPKLNFHIGRRHTSRTTSRTCRFGPETPFQAATHSENPETQYALYRLQQCVCWPRGSLGSGPQLRATALPALGGVHEVALDLSPLPQQHRVEAECCWTTRSFSARKKSSWAACSRRMRRSASLRAVAHARGERCGGVVLGARGGMDAP